MNYVSWRRRDAADTISSGQSAANTTCCGEVLVPLGVKMLRYFLRHTQNQQEAEDLLGKTFLKYLESLRANKVDLEQPIERYIWGIARHVLSDYWRFIYKKKRRQVRLEDNVGYKGENVELEEVESTIDFEKLLEWIRCNVKLSDFQYRVIEMRADGFSNALIATMLKSDQDRVTREFNRAKVKIQKIIKQDDVLE